MIFTLFRKKYQIIALVRGKDRLVLQGKRICIFPEVGEVSSKLNTEILRTLIEISPVLFLQLYVILWEDNVLLLVTLALGLVKKQQRNLEVQGGGMRTRITNSILFFFYLARESDLKLFDESCSSGICWIYLSSDFLRNLKFLLIPPEHSQSYPKKCATIF